MHFSFPLSLSYLMLPRSPRPWTTNTLAKTFKLFHSLPQRGPRMQTTLSFIIKIHCFCLADSLAELESHLMTYIKIHWQNLREEGRGGRRKRP